MIIESIIRRVGGTTVTLDGVLYEFKPVKPDGAHICKVRDPDHINQFLSVSDAFREYENQGVLTKKGSKGNTANDTGMPSNTKYDTMTKHQLAKLIRERGLSDRTLTTLKGKSIQTLIGMLIKADEEKQGDD